MVAPRSVDAIDEHLASVVARRSAVRFALRRRRDDIARADEDIVGYERQLLHCDQQIEELFDERDRTLHPERHSPDALMT